jgi:hypothetical protein
MKTIKITASMQMQVIKMLKNSMLVQIGNEKYFVTRRVFNILIDKTADQVDLFVIKKEYMGCESQWIAIPSIF